MSGSTHYEVLRIERGATAEQVRRAYRALARTLHPDVCRDADATARFTRLQQAYDVLSDRGARAAYDRELAGAAGPRRARGGAPTVGDAASVRVRGVREAAAANDREERDETFEELYEAFFGSCRKGEGAARGRGSGESGGRGG
ncbi:MAG: DnaJ domain-containing protein [Phycisphaerae bacterium]|nr:DnaJ domain-containing protein [Phycisphaerae bacterium]